LFVLYIVCKWCSHHSNQIIYLTIVTIKYVIINHSLLNTQDVIDARSTKEVIIEELVRTPTLFITIRVILSVFHLVYSFFRSFFIVLAFHALIYDYLSTVPAQLVFYHYLIDNYFVFSLMVVRILCACLESIPRE